MARTYRGYDWRTYELEQFRAFKRDGAIPRQARPERYAVDYDMDRNVRLWRMTRVRPGCPPNIYEQHIASIPARFEV